MKRTFIFLLASIFGLSPLAAADVCNPGKSNRDPEASRFQVAGLQIGPKSDPVDWDLLLAEAERELQNPAISGDDEQSALRKAAGAARQLEKLDKYIDYKIRVLELRGSAPYDHELENISKAFVELGQLKQAHIWATRWFGQAAYVLKEDYVWLAALSEQAKEFDAAALYAKCQLPNLPQTAPIQFTQIYSDLIRYAAKSGDKTLASNRINSLIEHIDQHMVTRPIFTSDILQQSIIELRAADMSRLAKPLARHAILKSSKATLTKLSALERSCESGDAEACVGAAQILKTEINMKDRQATSLEKACELDSLVGCHQLGVLYTFERSQENKERAQVLFTFGCQKEYGPSCNLAGYYFDKRIGNKENEDVSKALSLYKEGCRLGDGHSCLSLGQVYDAGSLDQQDYDQAKQFYQQACDAGVQQGCDSARFMRRRN